VADAPVKPSKRRGLRIAACMFLAVVAPALAAVATIYVQHRVTRAELGASTHTLVFWIGAAIGAAGASVAALMLPARPLVRIAAAAGCLAAVPFAFDWLCAVASLAIYVVMMSSPGGP
jgi:hypothetical protein